MIFRTVETLGGSYLQLTFGSGIEFDINSNCIYVADKHVIWKISLSGEVKKSIFCGKEGEKGNKDGPNATFDQPIGMILDPHSPILYVIELINGSMRKVTWKKNSSAPL